MMMAPAPIGKVQNPPTGKEGQQRFGREHC